MKRKNSAPAPKKPKSGLPCAIILLAATCGAIFLGIMNPPTARVAATRTSVAAAATATINDESTSARPTRPARSTLTLTPTDAPSETWYVISSANLRSCASTSCDRVANLSTGDQINVIGSERGATVSGSDIWQVVDHDGRRAYIHSSLVSEDPVQPAAAPVRVNTSAPAQQAVSRPGNCATAVAAGLSAEQAAQWLDRDNDGVACYGD